MGSTADRKVIAYVADINDVRAKLNELRRLNTQLGTQVGRDLGKGFREVGQSLGTIKTTETRKGLNDLANTSTQTTQILKGLDGSLVQVTQTTKVNSKGIAQTTTSYKDLNKNTVSLGENISRLAKRAALTIPLWLVLRGAVMGFFKTISDGIKTIQEQDKAFQKARRNLEATAKSQEELTSQFRMLQSEALKLSLKTGKSVEELTHAFQRFATVGFDATTSLTGMQYAAKLATVEFGDARETADAFARSMRVLIDTSAGAKSESIQIAEAMALTDQLWQTNAFEIQEFTQNLQKFAGTAKAANISTRETITLLATLSTGGLANRAGRLLRTTILKALQNLDEVALSLGLHINPAVDSTFDVVLKLVGALKQLSSTQNVPQELADVLGELFTVRTTEVLASLKALETTLHANAQVVPDIKKLNKTFEEITETTGVLIDRVHNANREIGKAFTNGLVGGENFNDSLKKIVTSLEAIQTVAQKTGGVIGDTFRTSPLVKFSEIYGAYKNATDTIVIGTQTKFANLGKQIHKALNDGMKVEDVRTLLKDISDFTDSNTLDLSFDERIIDALKTQLLFTKLRVEAEKDITKEQKARLITSTEQKEIAKIVLEHTLEIAKAEGATNSQILKTQNLLMKRLGIREQVIDKVNRELELERALSQEKRLQSELGNESLKLFRIVQESGVDIAKKIGDVLSGDIDFSSFIRRGGEAVDIFKKEFSDVFEQQQAKAFFTGGIVPDMKELRGGRGIAIEEEALRMSPMSTATGAILTQRKAERQFMQGQTVNQVNAPVNITANIDISKLDEVSKKVIDSISAQLPQAGTKINNALKNALVGKQTPTL